MERKGPVAPELFAARPALDADGAALLRLRRASATALTLLHGKGPWSLGATERGIAREIRTGNVLVGTVEGTLAGMLILARRRPWAIDPAYFAPATTPLYLTSMAVEPMFQGIGIGRLLIAAAVAGARSLGADAIRLDAYDTPAGAGGFYLKCDFAEMGRVVYRTTPLRYYELRL